MTKFMVLELVAAVADAADLRSAGARKRRRGTPRRPALERVFETMLLFLRDEVVRPAIGRHDADRFLPLIWTLFFFILVLQPAGAGCPGPVRRPARSA